MEWSTIEAKWAQYKARAKQRWDRLSQEQISNTRGKREYLVRRIQEIYALTADEAEREIADWQSRQIEVRPAANSWASSGREG